MKMLWFDLNKQEEQILKNNSYIDFEIELLNQSLNEKTNLTESQLEDTDIISVTKASLITDQILDQFKNLRIITTRSSEYDHIDRNYCKKYHIAIFNISDADKLTNEEIVKSTINSIKDYCKGMHTNQVY